MLLKLLKFGGSSIRDAECIRHVGDIISNESKTHNLIIVVSALGGVTDALYDMIDSSNHSNEVSDKLNALQSRHHQCVTELVTSERSYLIKRIDELTRELEQNLTLGTVEKLSLEVVDKILSYGELCSSEIMAGYLSSIGLASEPLDARKMIFTDSHFGNAYVHYQRSYDRIRDYMKKRQKQQIVTGFLGADEQGRTTTLGRSGSDYSAAIFGAALNVECIEIWTDVDGILTADPRQITDARTIYNLTYEEAMELAHAGAKVIFPPAMVPALYKQIPIKIKNTFSPDHPGSLITNDRVFKGEAAVGISSLSGVVLVRLQGSGMVGLRGVIGRIFSRLAKVDVNIRLVSQAFSEHSICFAINPQYVKIVIKTLKNEFSEELTNHTIDQIKIEKELSLVAVVGEGMKRTPGIAGKVFSTLGRNEINIIAIAQGSSERNISFIVEDRQLKHTLNVIHQDIINMEAEKNHIYLVGVGLVGKELLSIIQNKLPENLQLTVLGSSKKMLKDSSGIDLVTALDTLYKSDIPFHIDSLTSDDDASGKKIFVDCTASEQIALEYANLMEKGFSIVTANKIANSGSQKYYHKLRKMAESQGVDFYYETNVGAGLPVISTINNLINTGDEIISIEGVFSGTLSYLFNEFDSNMAFSSLVKEARSKGYTEPDPRHDLNGLDVARKLLILARETGADLELSDISVQSLIPEGGDDIKSVEDFLEFLTHNDDTMRQMVRKAEKNEKALRYIASFTKKTAEISLKEIGTNHPFYNLNGSENIFAITSHRYYDTPLVIKGHGAGAAVTAAGVLADILACR